MTSQPEFDRLRRTCSTQLSQFISEARQTELQAQPLRLPVGAGAALQFLCQRGVEFDACYTERPESLRIPSSWSGAPCRQCREARWFGRTSLAEQRAREFWSRRR
jgi:hypothetical protein